MMVGLLSGGGRHSVNFNDVISIENLFRAWRRFKKGKESKADVAVFALRLEENIFGLHEALKKGVWKSDPYIRLYISDPKPRIIHKASVRDRVLFQAVYQSLYQVFDKTFIHDSYASREGKGTHAGVRRFGVFARKVSQNYTHKAFVLKCDVQKFFDCIDHAILLSLLAKRISSLRLFSLARQIVKSFHTVVGKGLPLGNVTSQLFANIYLNELDQFIKHTFKAKYYIRYCDDFVIVHENRDYLESCIPRIVVFLRNQLKLQLHPRKISIHPLSFGTDFLGYVSLPYYTVLRTRTKRRILKRLVSIAGSIKTKEDFHAASPVIQSYLGMLTHCKGEKIRGRIEHMFENFTLK